MPGKAREMSSTGIYHVMLRGINRQTIFEDEGDCVKNGNYAIQTIHE